NSTYKARSAGCHGLILPRTSGFVTAPSTSTRHCCYPPHPLTTAWWPAVTTKLPQAWPALARHYLPCSSCQRKSARFPPTWETGPGPSTCCQAHWAASLSSSGRHLGHQEVLTGAA